MATLAPAHPTERSAWRAFAMALVSLAGAMALALYSSSAAATGQVLTAALSAISALGIAGWVAITIVPVLARRTTLNWLSRTEYNLTREGFIYLGGIFIVALAAVNTGNNLLFMILSCLLAGIVVSGILSQIVLSRIELRLELPEHIFAGQPVVAIAELVNHKPMLPSFSLRLTGAPPAGKQRKDAAAAQPAPQILSRPVYFPYLPHRQSAQQSVELLFPHRGLYRQDVLKLATRFPFSFLEKARRIPSDLRVVVYPPVEPTEEFYEILPLVSGELESYTRGRGHDLYGIRPYQTSDSARHVDWKASAKTGLLQVREYAREDERRVVLVFDGQQPGPVANPRAVFERGIGLAASLAWHFYEIDSVLGFRGAGFETNLAPAGEVIYDVLDYLATAAPKDPEPPRPSVSPIRTFLDQVAEEDPNVFKIVVTCQPRGGIPTSLWSSSFILFLNETV